MNMPYHRGPWDPVDAVYGFLDTAVEGQARELV